jgi:hypothetical protein
MLYSLEPKALTTLRDDLFSDYKTEAFLSQRLTSREMVGR